MANESLQGTLQGEAPEMQKRIIKIENTEKKVQTDGPYVTFAAKRDEEPKERSEIPVCHFRKGERVFLHKDLITEELALY